MRAKSTLNRRANKVICEALENRRLMSLTIEVRNTDGTATGTATSVGQVLNLEVLAVISSSDNQPTEDGFQDAVGSFISTAGGKHSVAGNLVADTIAPFAAFGSQKGTQQDLNGDGNTDVGSNDPVNTDGYFHARASSLQTSGTGTIAGNTLVFKIATLNYAVTSLGEGGETSINFSPFVTQIAEAAAWVENGSQQEDNTIGTFQAGTPYTLSDPSLIPAPTAVADSATVAINTATVINELSNDDVIQPLNPASVTITVGANHGTTLLQSNGSVLYTPDHGYLGADSFTYTVADTDGRTSNPAIVSITVVPTPAPTAGYVSQTTFLDQPLDVNVLSHASSQATLVPSSVTVASTPAHGTALTQSDGSILYTPDNGYIGADAFTYTVGDSNGETSSVAQVTITVSQPVLPTANNDSFNIVGGTPTDLNVMANDKQGSITSNTTVHLTSNVSHGTIVVQSDQTVLYTPAPGYTGTDSFTYVLVDALEEASEPATVTLTIAAAAPPSAGNVTVPILSGQTGSINVLANVSGGAPIVPTSVTVVTAPANGKATVNSDGSISYTPIAGFVGTDTFTYTAADTNGTVTTPGTVTIDVGTSISNAKGSAHSIVFTDAASGAENVSLNKGVAEIFFTGDGSLTVAKNGKATVTGPGLNVASLALSNTTKASSLTIKGSAKTPVTVGGITDSSPLGTINAPAANFSGNINLNQTNSITLDSFTNGSITAASITSMTIKTGGLASNLSTGAIGSLSVAGDLTGNITASAIKSLHITGNMTGSNIDVSGTLGNLQLTGRGATFTDSNIQANAFTSASLGNVTTDNSGTTFGITAKSIGSFTGKFAGSSLHLSRHLLQNEEVLQAYLNQQGILFGDFGITLNG